MKSRCPYWKVEYFGTVALHRPAPPGKATQDEINKQNQTFGTGSNTNPEGGHWKADRGTQNRSRKIGLPPRSNECG